MEVKDSPVNGTSASGLPAAERLVSLGRSGPIARRRFPETPLTPCGGNFLTSVQTVSQSAGPGASVPCVRHGSQAADIDRRQLVYPSLERRCGRRGPARVRPSWYAGLGWERLAEARAVRRGVSGSYGLAPALNAISRMSPPQFGQGRFGRSAPPTSGSASPDAAPSEFISEEPYSCLSPTQEKTRLSPSCDLRLRPLTRWSARGLRFPRRQYLCCS